MSLFEFTADDLQRNQRGQLSASQQQWLAMTARGVRGSSRINVGIAVGFVLLGLGITAGLYLQNERTRAALFANPTQLLLIPLALVLIFGLIGLTIFLARRTSQKLMTAQVQSAQGKVRLDETTGEYGTTYYVYVGRKKFGFSEDLSQIFQEGQRYKVYYCKASAYEMILSYEKLASS